jgi:molybdopterin-guanine dinucleotide biosynthesis protein A
MEVAAAIIAGGKGVRFGGRVKALLEVGGRTILARQLAVLRPLCGEVVVNANDPAPFAGCGARVVADELAGEGPLSGLGAALAAVRAPWLLIVASDMPYLEPRLLELLIARASDDVDVVMPTVGGYPEPLCAMYSQRCAPVIAARLAAAHYRASALVTEGELRVAWVDEDELRAVDPDLRTFVNVNAPTDLAR